MENKARQLGIELPQKVSEFLASKITSNIRELEGALRRVIAHSQLLSDKEITLDMTQDVLKDMLRSYDKRTTIDEIQKRWPNISTFRSRKCSLPVVPARLPGRGRLPCIWLNS